MKIASFFTVSLLTIAAGNCYGAQLFLPVDGTPLDPLGSPWTQAEPNASPLSPKAWYSTVGPYKSVSVGAFFDTFADPFYAQADLGSSPLVGSSVSWFASITDYVSGGGFETRNDYSISFLNASESNLLTLDFTNVTGSAVWNVSANGGSAFAAVVAGTTFAFSVDFVTNDADADYTVTFDGFSDTGSILNGATAFIRYARIGETLGFDTDMDVANTEFGDGFISVVPEPSSVMLVSLLPGFFILRRRR